LRRGSLAASRRVATPSWEISKRRAPKPDSRHCDLFLTTRDPFLAGPKKFEHWTFLKLQNLRREDHDLEWLERWIAETETVCPDWKHRA
jgi:hypothetical protein